jgi:tripartite-type tricarboxylate transporter receptor subunit TctC
MAALGVAALVAAKPAQAQGNQQAGTFPQRAVTFVLPGPAGGGPDQVIRLDNKPGATGMIGAEAIARSEPTGYKLLFTLTALVQAPAVFAKVPYDRERDFAPLTQVANAPVFLTVRSDSAIRSLGDQG